MDSRAALRPHAAGPLVDAQEVLARRRRRHEEAGRQRRRRGRTRRGRRGRTRQLCRHQARDLRRGESLCVHLELVKVAITVLVRARTNETEEQVFVPKIVPTVAVARGLHDRPVIKIGGHERAVGVRLEAARRRRHQREVHPLVDGQRPHVGVRGGSRISGPFVSPPRRG